MYISDHGNIVFNYLNAKDILATMRSLCKGQSKPIPAVYSRFDLETHNGKNMSRYFGLLTSAIKSIVEVKKESAVAGLFKAGGTHFNTKETIEGIDDFELVCFLVIK